MFGYRTLLFLLLPAALGAQQLNFATYAGGSADESTAGIARDSLGNVYLAGATESTDFPIASSAGGGFVVKFDANGNKLGAMLIPGAEISITAVAVNTAVTPNTIIVAGIMPSGAIAATAGAYSAPNATAFISTLNSTLTQTQWTATISASPAALAIDSSGNIYATGSAQNAFVTTPGAFQAANKGAVNAFVLKLSSGGATALYATFLGGSGDDSASAIAVDATGDVYLTGTTTSPDFPLVNPAQPQFGGVLPYFSEVFGDAFVAKLDPKGATLLYSTYLGGAAADAGHAIAIDSSGNAYVAGSTQSATWLAGPATGTFQTTYAGPTPDPNAPNPAGDAFLAKFSPAGALLWYTYLGGSGEDEARAVALDNSGNIFVAGNNGSTNFPQAGNPVPDCHIGGRPFLAEFNSTGAQLLMTTGLSGMGFDQAYYMAFDAAHDVAYLAGDVESVVFFATPGAAQTTYGGGDDDSFVARVDTTLQAPLEVSCVLNGASFLAGNTSSYPTGAVAPGEIVSLFGAGLGPTPAASLQLTSAGTVSTAIGGMAVLFDGLPAPLLYAGNGQINAVVPYGINSSTTNMTVKTAANTVGPIPMPVNSAVPAIFMCGAYCNDVSQAAALNSDGTLNTVANPAARGDYITFYLCGPGMMSNDTDGTVSAPPLAMPSQQVTVTIRGVNAQVQYAGAAPGFVNGLMQINVYIPTTIDFGNHVPLSVNVGNYSSQDNVTIAVK
jgi:uncharacterized protein (TIGR03437 family)